MKLAEYLAVDRSSDKSLVKCVELKQMQESTSYRGEYLQGIERDARVVEIFAGNLMERIIFHGAAN